MIELKHFPLNVIIGILRLKSAIFFLVPHIAFLWFPCLLVAYMNVILEVHPDWFMFLNVSLYSIFVFDKSCYFDLAFNPHTLYIFLSKKYISFY